MLRHEFKAGAPALNCEGGVRSANIRKASQRWWPNAASGGADIGALISMTSSVPLR